MTSNSQAHKQSEERKRLFEEQTNAFTVFNMATNCNKQEKVLEKRKDKLQLKLEKLKEESVTLLAERESIK